MLVPGAQSSRRQSSFARKPPEEIRQFEQQSSPAWQSAAALQQPVTQRPAEQHSPALQSAAVAQPAPATHSFVPGSQHSPALQSAFESQAQGPQRPSWQHSPALQSALAAQHGSH
jgi:hypothetical protein